MEYTNEDLSIILLEKIFTFCSKDDFSVENVHRLFELYDMLQDYDEYIDDEDKEDSKKRIEYRRDMSLKMLDNYKLRLGEDVKVKILAACHINLEIYETYYKRYLLGVNDANIEPVNFDKLYQNSIILYKYLHVSAISECIEYEYKCNEFIYKINNPTFAEKSCHNICKWLREHKIIPDID